MRVRHAAALALLAVLAAAGPAAAQGLGARDAAVRDVEFESEERTFPSADVGGAAGSATWRVVEGTGNCCETYLGTDGGGRLFDFGGNYVNFSDDRGLTWQQVRPEESFIGGEGAIVTAPDGDVLGVGWDPYTGDRLLAFRYDAKAAKWRYATMPLHAPFYDREWIAVVPGPLQVDGRTVPWVSFVKGGYPSKEEWLYSTDGLTYTSVSSKFAETAGSAPVAAPLPVAPAPAHDVIQPNAGMGLTPLGAGRALAAPDRTQGSWALLDPATLTWEPYSFPGSQPTGQYHVDSRGRLHNLVAQPPDDLLHAPGGSDFEYRLSEDGGRTWRAAKVLLGEGLSIENADFRVHGALGIAAVALHVGDERTGTDRDLLFKLDVRGGQPALLRRYDVGLGDVAAGGNVLALDDPRFDFESLAIFPDGRVAMSFMDSETGAEPAIAVELSEPLPPGFSAGALPTGRPAGPARPVRRPGSTDRGGPRGRHRVKLRARRRGGRVAVSGTVLPRHRGHRVRLQARRGGRWATVARVRANGRSAFRVTLPRRARRVRARAAADSSGHRAGRSRAVAVR